MAANNQQGEEVEETPQYTHLFLPPRWHVIQPPPYCIMFILIVIVVKNVNPS
jgi:hypothetical protein